ncbi:MAG: GH32 C-terminal domain-containing protein, partial [Mogibacterium sp.]|nr:GH32 C-terminal domain-containing protein [Mogibacterium sp.]
TLLANDGRRVMIAWMQNWETTFSKPRDISFVGQMILPRELSISGGRLCQNPVREIENYRKDRFDYHNVMVCGSESLYGISGRYIDMTVTIHPSNEKDMYEWIRIYVANDGDKYTYIRFRPDKSTIKVDRTHSGFPHDIVNVREFPVDTIDGVLKLRIILDRYSLELFVNDGMQAASFILYTPIDASAISFSSKGNVLIDIEKYELEIDD